jgi:D-glycero-beta-D-manno-heptose-7-phosphate kinase
MTAMTLATLIPKLAQQDILVIGDVLLDEYLIGQAKRMSREAPIPVLEFESRQLIPGGAANPACNIAALGSQPVQIGVIGADGPAHTLRGVLAAKGIAADGLVTDPTRPTTVKLRVMAQMGLRFPQQVARLDTLSREPISTEVEQAALDRIQPHLSKAQAALFSDYHGGFLTPTLVEAARDQCRKKGILLTADAQGALEKYSEFDVVKCNADDAALYLNRELQNDADFASAAQDLCAALHLKGGMVITRGPEGATAVTVTGQVDHCRAPAVTDVYDTVGAGDTAIAVLTLALGAGASLRDATTLANYASGLVVRRVGNYAPSPDELTWALDTWSVG